MGGSSSKKSVAGCELARQLTHSYLACQ